MPNHRKITLFLILLCQYAFCGDISKSFQEINNAIYFSYGKNEYTILDDLSYEFLSINYLRDSDSLGTRITGGFLERYPEGYEQNEKYLIIMPRLYQNWRYFSYSIGFCLFLLTEGDTPNFILPVGGIKIGDKDQLYVSADFLNEDLLDFFEIGVNYNFLNNFALLSIGVLKTDRWFVKIKTVPLKYLYLAISVAYDFSDKAPGFRIGIGTAL